MAGISGEQHSSFLSSREGTGWRYSGEMTAWTGVATMGRKHQAPQR